MIQLPKVINLPVNALRTNTVERQSTHMTNHSRLTPLNVTHKPKHSMIDESTSRPLRFDYTKVDRLTERLAKEMPLVPFGKLKPSAESMKVEKPKRSKRRSKFSPQQDDMILNMKRANKSWVEIAEVAGVDSFLAARNRYQVLIGQQGGSSSDCGPEDVLILKKVVDEAEIEKMKHLTKEFTKCTGKPCNYKQVRELIRYLFWKDASKFDVHDDYVDEVQKLQALRREEFGGPGYDNGDDIDDVKTANIDVNADIDAAVTVVPVGTAVVGDSGQPEYPFSVPVAQ